MWDLPRPGLETVSPALAGRFLTTAPPGKSQSNIFLERASLLKLCNKHNETILGKILYDKVYMIIISIQLIISKITKFILQNYIKTF